MDRCGLLPNSLGHFLSRSLSQLRSSDPGMVMVTTMGWTLPCQSPFKQFLTAVPTTLPELRFLFSEDKLTVTATHSSPFSLGLQWFSILWWMGKITS